MKEIDKKCRINSSKIYYTAVNFSFPHQLLLG